MSGRYFRQNHWKKVERFPASISYAYLMISYEEENANADFFDQYYPINVVLTKEAISFYSSNLLEYASKNQASLQSYQSQAFLSFSLENPFALEREIDRVDKMTSDKVVESLFTFSTDLDYKEIDKSNERKDAIGADFLSDLLPDLSGVIKEDQSNYYKIIFLNFLNDFFYSNTFKNHPNYKRTRQLLEENKTIKAILAKGYYSYALEKNKALLDEKEVIQKETVKKWKSRLTDAAEDWHALIIDKEYDNTIKTESTWFKDKETEHKELMNGLYDEKEKVLSTDQVTDSVNWLSNRYNLFEAFCNQFGYLLRREPYSLFYAVLIWAITFVTTIFFITIEPINIDNNVVAVCITLMILIVLKIMYIGEELLNHLTLSSRDFFFIIIGIIVAIAVGVGIVYDIDADWALLLILLSLFSGFLIMSLGLIKVLQRIIPSRWMLKNLITSRILSIPKYLRLFKPRILLVSTSIWAVIYVNSELWNIDFLIGSVEVIILCLLLIILFVFTFSKLKKYIRTGEKKADSYRLFSRSAFLILLGFIYSVCLGVGPTTIAMKNTFVKEGYYKGFFEALDNDFSEGDRTRSALEKRLTDSLYMEATSFLYGKAIPNEQLDTIIAYTQPKANINKKLLKQILPHLNKSTVSNKESKLVYHIKVNLPQWKNANSSKPFLFDFYIVPDFLIFYSIIATVIGMFIELFLKEKE